MIGCVRGNAESGIRFPFIRRDSSGEAANDGPLGVAVLDRCKADVD